MPKPPDVNELLDAVRQAIPQAPPPPWMTRAEMQGALGITRSMAERRIQLLTEQGRLERMLAPRREDGVGSTWYYKLKNGKAK